MLTMPAPATSLSLTDEQRLALDRLARSTSARHRTVQQAQALLLASEGAANNEIARRVGVSANSLDAWNGSRGRQRVLPHPRHALRAVS